MGSSTNDQQAISLQTISEQTMSEQELQYWIALSYIPGFHPRHFFRLLQYFHSGERIFHASLKELSALHLSASFVERFTTARKAISPLQCLASLKEHALSATTFNDPSYPQLLRHISDPPFLLYYKGMLQILQQPCISIVGTRKATRYGEQALAKILPPLAAQGITIVSGLALGIDTLAHAMTLAQHGHTAAVIGSGLQRLYPRQNETLATKITENGGVLVSEFSPFTEPHPSFFPQRNRIIAGLCAGTLVVEAGEKSGALITAHYAIESGREVMAIPGSLFQAQSRGCIRLIKEGAVPITSAQDVLETLHLPLETTTRQPLSKKQQPLHGEETKILAMLAKGHQTVETLILESNIAISRLNAILMQLELNNMVKELDSGEYVLL